MLKVQRFILVERQKAFSPNKNGIKRISVRNYSHQQIFFLEAMTKLNKDLELERPLNTEAHCCHTIKKKNHVIVSVCK